MKNQRNKLRSVAMLAVAFGILPVSGWAQCVMCATALASSPEGQALAGSFRYGILVLMVMPYMILGLISYGVFRAYRKRRVLTPQIRAVGAVYDRAMPPN